jgi:membrane-bound serine protease (ClpP class)
VALAWSLLVAFVGFAVDVQTGVPRAWTAAGGVLFAVGSLFLYDGLSMSWVTLLVASLVGVALTFLAGMPAMVRTRFSTPTIGREWMIGELGGPWRRSTPTGWWSSASALWRARTNRATPITDGDRVRVVGIDGWCSRSSPRRAGPATTESGRPRGRPALTLRGE